MVVASWISFISIYLVSAEPSWKTLFQDLSDRYKTEETTPEESPKPQDEKSNQPTTSIRVPVDREKIALDYCVKNRRIPKHRSIDPEEIKALALIRALGGSKGFYERHKATLRVIPEIRIQVQDPRMDIDDPLSLEEFYHWVSEGRLSHLQPNEYEELRWNIDKWGVISDFIVTHRRWPQQNAKGSEARIGQYINVKGGNHTGAFQKVSQQAQSILLAAGYNPDAKKSHLKQTFLSHPEEVVSFISKHSHAVLFVGFGKHLQYKDPEEFQQKLDRYAENLNSRYGRGRWIAIYGGDQFDLERPDIAHAMMYLHQAHHVKILSISNDIIADKPIPEFVTAYHFTPTVKSDDKIIWGGLLNGELVGPSRIYLGTHSNTPVINSVVSIGGGQTALQELKHAQLLKIPITYIKATPRFGSESDPFGPVDTWIQSQCASSIKALSQ